MSDYFTRLIERSLGLAPQIEPLIAPIHAPSGQMLSETVETSATFEWSPAAKIENPRQDVPSGVAVKARAAEPAFSQMGSQPGRPSIPLPESRAEFPVEKKDDRAPAPLSHATRIPSKGKKQIVVQPEVVNHVKPATPPAVSSPQPSPKESPAIVVSCPAPLPSRPETAPPAPRPIPGTTGAVSKKKNQIVVQPELVSPLKPAAGPAVSLVQPLPKEPPAIHVTIGRVEVRAVMPAAQVKPPPERSVPKMSLDDYLRSRNGGAA